MSSAPIVDLAEAVDGLRRQLCRIRAEGQDEELGFRVGPVELSVQAIVEKDANGRVGWGVLGVGGEYRSGITQTIKLTLVPVRRTANGTVTTDFTIADQQPAGQRFGSRAQHPAQASS